MSDGRQEKVGPGGESALFQLKPVYRANTTNHVVVFYF